MIVQTISIEVVNKLSKENLSEILRIMHSSAKREKYAYDIVEKISMEVINKRKYINMPVR